MSAALSPVFRPAQPAEAPAIHSLYRRAAANGRSDGSSDWDEDYPGRAILDGDLEAGRLYVLIDRHELIAAVSLMEHDDLDDAVPGWTAGRSCVPVRLCVAPERQRQGLGGLMMRHLAERAREAGYASTRHLSSLANAAAERLYQRMGYRLVGTVRLYGKDFHAWEMLL